MFPKNLPLSLPSPSSSPPIAVQNGFVAEENDMASVVGEEEWNVQLFRSIDNFSAKFTEDEKKGVLGRRKQVEGRRDVLTFIIFIFWFYHFSFSFDS